jgi:hypothetical protein
MTAAIHDHSDAAGYRRPTDPRNVGIRLSSGTDPDGAGFACDTSVADIDVGVSGGKIDPRAVTDCNVVTPAAVLVESADARGGIMTTRNVAPERGNPISRVITADIILVERTVTGGRILGPAGIIKKRFDAIGGVGSPGAIGKE